ncbi:MAG: succinylglutamate desuccinylase/aspartoacylase family protein [Alphaproteobacteria bacterium]|jgi:predicted deacylase
MTSSATRIWTDLDFQRSGKQVGALMVDHSVTRSAYGMIPVPAAVIGTGDGPTVLMVAGTHGDEYEGQIVLSALIRELDPAAVNGRLIILPALNLPAAKAGERVSPYDGGNLNRVYPGDPAGGPTQQIAYYVESVLMPLCDVFMDLHSGGSSLDYLPLSTVGLTGNDAIDIPAVALADAFNAPNTMIWSTNTVGGNSEDAAQRNGLIALSGEFGGRGVASPSGIALVRRGVRNGLIHLGILEGAIERVGKSRLIDVPGYACYVYAPREGVYVPACELGDMVEAGQVAGTIHNPEQPDREPATIAFKSAGLLVCERAKGRCEPGDCLAHLAVDFTGTLPGL